MIRLLVILLLFAAGAGPAQTVVRRVVALTRQVAQDQVTCVVAGVLVFAVACTPLAGPLRLGPLTVWEETAKHLLYAASAVLFMLPAVLGTAEGRVARAMSAPWLRWLGLISYGIFLWHLLVLRLLFEVTDAPVFSGGFWWAWPVTVALTVPVAWASYRLVERPVAEWVRRRTARARLAPPTGADDAHGQGQEGERSHRAAQAGGR